MPRERFLTKERTAEYENAVNALKVLAEQDLDLAAQAYAEATHEYHKEAFGKKHGLREDRGSRICFQRLLGRTCREESHRLPPGCDHRSLWLREKTPEIFVSQPYEFTLEDFSRTVAFCKEHDLICYLRASESWHFPGKTFSILYKRQSE